MPASAPLLIYHFVVVAVGRASDPKFKDLNPVTTGTKY
jgi:hypothetical protein